MTHFTRLSITYITGRISFLSRYNRANQSLFELYFIRTVYSRSDLNLYANITEALIGMPLDYFLADCI